MEQMTRIQTAALWNRVIVEIPKSKRGESISPACGPLPVTKVPIAIAMKESDICAADNREIRVSVEEVLTWGVLRREWSEVAAAIKKIESRK
jgi:molybdenum cofactor biosynthesis enzyme